MIAAAVRLAAQSLPVRGAWIEIEHGNDFNMAAYVAPCEGSVD